MKTLKELLISNCGADVVTEKYTSEMGYDEEALSSPVRHVGTCGEGVDVYEIEYCPGYHVSSPNSEGWEQDEPEGFELGRLSCASGA